MLSGILAVLCVCKHLILNNINISLFKQWSCVKFHLGIYYLQSAFKKFLPMFDRVLVQRFAAETKTKGGVLIPEKAQSKVLSAKVVAIGTGGRNEVNE